ncbi:CdaR family protein [Lachnoclostridium sp. An76]|uniref:CdaR family protein n=1 Tax=Lachnoclostridium sp. An76 TaxID=1965654 RepID=UPI0019D43670|nr:CdaR family protein [Lachnoclostridium sp. An76]
MKKYKLTTNLGLKVIAFIFAVFLWFIVVNFDNPVGSSTFRDIPVQILNDDIITSAGEVYQVEGDRTVTVVVYATREVRQKLTSDNIVATADIKQIDSTGRLVPIEVTINGFSGESVTAEAIPRNLTIQREKSGKKVMSLTVDTEGVKLADGYILGDASVEPDQVTITGAESVLDQVDRAVAQVDEVEGVSEDSVLPASLVLYDANGNELNQTQMSNNLGEEGLSVSVEVMKVKGIPVVFDVEGSPAEGYKYSGCVSTPESVQVCGKSEDIDKISEIDVPASVVDISGASEPIEMSVDITPYLPEGVELVDENSGNVKVTVKIEQEGTLSIDFMVSSIRINNLAENLQVSYEPDAEITFRFTGDEDLLDTLDISNAVSVDLSDYDRPGTYDVPVKVNLPAGISQDGQVTVQLTLAEKASEGDQGSQGGEE